MKKLLLGSLFVASLSMLSTGCGDIEVPLSTTLCEDMCEAQSRAACGSFNPTTCVRACRSIYQQAPQCEAQLDTALRCGIAAGYTCSGSLVRVRGCEAEGSAMTACLANSQRAATR